jgi:tetratricopeptide (TPR) repeat protein
MSLLTLRPLCRSLAPALALALGLGSGGAVAAGCSRRDASEEGAAVVDTELLAYLSSARALHHLADLKQQNGDLPGAVTAIEKLLATRRPHEGHALPEVSEVLADAHARLAELQSERGDVDAAIDAARRGLVYAPESTYFRGHLFEVQGIALKTRAAALADAGQNEEASRARRQATVALEDAVRIQAQVIQRSLPDAEAPR